MITRRTLFAENSLLEEEIAELNARKSENFDAYREQMKEERLPKAEIAKEIAGCKKAFRIKRLLDKDADAVHEQDALVDEIVAELDAPEPTGTEHALARASRTRPKPVTDRQSLPGGDGGSAGLSAPGSTPALSEPPRSPADPTNSPAIAPPSLNGVGNGAAPLTGGAAPPFIDDDDLDVRKQAWAQFTRVPAEARS